MPGVARDAFLPDETYADQMALRDTLLSEQRDHVLACQGGAQGAARELLAMAVREAGSLAGFEVGEDWVRRPDGMEVPLEFDAPLHTIGRLFQQDFCILQDGVLTGAVLCFPGGWTLSEKLGHPMARIHRPVAIYTSDLARRVDRLFETLKPGRALWRANAHHYDFADLYAPRRETDPARQKGPDAPYIRSERQTLFRLPQTGAVVFAIHTLVLKRSALTPEQAAALHPRTGPEPRSEATG